MLSILFVILKNEETHSMRRTRILLRREPGGVVGGGPHAMTFYYA